MRVSRPERVPGRTGAGTVRRPGRRRRHVGRRRRGRLAGTVPSDRAGRGSTARRVGAGRSPLRSARRVAVPAALGVGALRVGPTDPPRHGRAGPGLVRRGRPDPSRRPRRDHPRRRPADLQLPLDRGLAAPHRRPGRARPLLQRRHVRRPARPARPLLHLQWPAPGVRQRRPRPGRRGRHDAGRRHGGSARSVAARRTLRSRGRVQADALALPAAHERHRRGRARVLRDLRPDRAQPFPVAERPQRRRLVRPALRARHRAGGPRRDRERVRQRRVGPPRVASRPDPARSDDRHLLPQRDLRGGRRPGGT